MKPQKNPMYIYLFILILIAMKGQSQDLTLDLSTSYYGDYNISYFGGNDGYIDLTVSGGLPPFTYKWSNGILDQDVSDLAAGYYKVYVWDNGGHSAEAEITLTEPGLDINSNSPCASNIIPQWSGYTSPLTHFILAHQ